MMWPFSVMPSSKVSRRVATLRLLTCHITPVSGATPAPSTPAVHTAGSQPELPAGKRTD